MTNGEQENETPLEGFLSDILHDNADEGMVFETDLDMCLEYWCLRNGVGCDERWASDEERGT